MFEMPRCCVPPLPFAGSDGGAEDHHICLQVPLLKRIEQVQGPPQTHRTNLGSFWRILPPNKPTPSAGYWSNQQQPYKIDATEIQVRQQNTLGPVSASAKKVSN